MNQYYLIIDQDNHYKLQENAPVNKKEVVLIIQLSPQQKQGFETLISERNSLFGLAKITCERNHLSNQYKKVLDDEMKQISFVPTANATTVNGSSDYKARVNRILSKELMLDKSFVHHLFTHEKAFGKVFQPEQAPSLFQNPID